MQNFETLLADTQWHADGFTCRDLHFVYEHAKDTGSDGLVFYKTRELVDQYRSFFAANPALRVNTLLELGIWEGGSVAFWHHYLQPERHVAIDLKARFSCPHFQRYLQSHAGQVHIEGGFDQADSQRLRKLVQAQFNGQLDLVIDDASHLYAPSKASFETLFPLLPAGAVYLIEDWAWEHWAEFNKPSHPWAGERPLTDLIAQIIAAAGTPTDLIRKVEIHAGFVAVHRGGLVLAQTEDFRLENHIQRRDTALGAEAASPLRHMAVSLKRRLKRWLVARGLLNV